MGTLKVALKNMWKKEIGVFVGEGLAILFWVCFEMATKGWLSVALTTFFVAMAMNVGLLAVYVIKVRKTASKIIRRQGSD